MARFGPKRTPKHPEHPPENPPYYSLCGPLPKPSETYRTLPETHPDHPTHPFHHPTCTSSPPGQWFAAAPMHERQTGLAVNTVRMFMNTCSRSLFTVPVQI